MCVGKTKLSLESRLTNHTSSAKRHLALGRECCRSQKWILELLSTGIRPGIRLLATTDDFRWKATEKRFISKWRRLNPRLLNSRNGGDGPDFGKAKEFCEKHKIKYTRYAGGQGRCSQCHREWKCTAAGKAYIAAQNRSPYKRKYLDAYKRTPKYRAYGRVAAKDYYWRNRAKILAYHRKRNSRLHGQA